MDSSSLVMGNGEGVYLFCFARPAALPTIDGICLPEGCHLFGWVFKDILAVLGKVRLEDFCGPSAEAHLQDINWIAPRAGRHEDVIERVMRRSPVLPARFGTIFSALENLGLLVEIHYEKISHFLGYVAGKEEWAIKGLVALEKVEDRLLRHKLSTLPPSPGMRYLLEQRMRAEVGKEIKSWVKTVSESISQELEKYAVEYRSRKILPREASGRELDMAFNWAFLVTIGAWEDFSNRVKYLQDTYYQEGLSLEISGPWPPYSFCPNLTEPASVESKEHG